MAGTPNNWSVVVRGAWNPAILTPAGIAKRVLGLEDGTPVEVLVALDKPGLLRVVQQNIAVSPSMGQLLIEPTAQQAAGELKRAADCARRAVQSLPETPLTACGVNLKYTFDALSDQMTEMFESSLDDSLADDNRQITGRFMRRVVTWNEGVINIEIEERADASGSLTFNFHRDSTMPVEHSNWLGRTDEMVAAAEHLLPIFGA